MQLLMQAAIVLLVYSTSGAGYYTHPGFEDIMTLGYIKDRFAEFENSLALIGTLASIVAVAILPFLRRLRWPMLLSAFLALQLYYVASGVWSNVLLDSVYAAIKICVYAVALWVALTHLNTRQTISALAVAFALIGAASAFLALTNTVFSISLGAEGWRGLFMTKNQFGAFCLFGIVLLFPACFLGRGTQRLLVIGLTAMLTTLLVLSQSKTSGVLAALYMVLSYCAHRLSINGKKRQALQSVAIVWVAVVITVAPPLLNAVASGELTFTGRVDVWRYFVQMLNDKYVFGMGGYSTPLDKQVGTQALINTYNAGPDSSWVSIFFNLGIIGLTLYVLFIGASLKFHFDNLSQYSTFAFCGVLVYVTFGAVESSAQLTLGLPTFALLGQIFISALLARKSGAQSRTKAIRPLPPIRRRIRYVAGQTRPS